MDLAPASDCTRPVRGGVYPPRMDLCPLCAGTLVEIRSKAVCSSCGRIVEGCCEGAATACGAVGEPETA